MVNSLFYSPLIVIFQRSSNSLLPAEKYYRRSSLAFIYSSAQPPHPRALERSLPVPKGMMAAGGLFFIHLGIVLT